MYASLKLHLETSHAATYAHNLYNIGKAACPCFWYRHVTHERTGPTKKYFSMHVSYISYLWFNLFFL
jgi:hypothetical protein